MSQIVVLGQFDVHSDDASAAADLMRVMTNESVKEKGCHHYAYSRDLTAPGRFQLSELWEDDASLTAHASAEHTATYRAGMKNLRVIRRKVTRYEAASPKEL